jgi:hypothetical protein
MQIFTSYVAVPRCRNLHMLLRDAGPPTPIMPEQDLSPQRQQTSFSSRPDLPRSFRARPSTASTVLDIAKLFFSNPPSPFFFVRVPDEDEGRGFWMLNLTSSGPRSRKFFAIDYRSFRGTISFTHNPSGRQTMVRKRSVDDLVSLSYLTFSARMEILHVLYGTEHVVSGQESFAW